MNAARPRWGQLAYTSASAGYGVHAASADLSPVESAALVSGADAGRTSFGDDVPAFPSAEQVARFARNMVWRGLPDLGMGLWHSAPAGPDRSGRAGNCYIHALVERDGAAPERRPIELWRSPDLLTPFGPDAVAASVLPELPLACGPITRDLVCDFLLDPEHWRLGTLSRLLAALSEPTGQPVVLGVASANDGALWIAAVSYFLSPAAALAFTFAVWEHAASVQGGRQPQVELLCLSEGDVDAVANRPGWVVLRDSDDAAPVGWSAGSPAGVAWGNLALQLFSLSVEPSAVLEEIDTLAARVGDRHLARSWPLAMVMASRLEQWPSLRPMLADVLIPSSPAHIGNFPEEFAVTVDLVESALGDGVGALLTRIRSLGRAPLLDVLRRAYVHRAVVDHVWLTAGLAPGRSAQSAWVPGSQESEVPHLREAIFRATQEADPTDRAVLLLRMADFVGQEGWSRASTSELLVTQFDNALEQHVAPLLVTAQARVIMERVGPLSDVGLTSVIWEPLRNLARDPDAAGAPLGRRLSFPVVQWLAPQDLVVQVRPDGENPLLLEAAVAHLREASRGLEPEDARGQGVLRALQRQVVRLVIAWGGEDSRAHEALRAASEAVPLRLADILELQAAIPQLLPASCIAAALLTPPGSEPGRLQLRVVDGVRERRLERSRDGEDLYRALATIDRVRRPGFDCWTIRDAMRAGDAIVRAAADVHSIAARYLPHGIAGTWLSEFIAPAVAVSTYPSPATLWGDVPTNLPFDWAHDTSVGVALREVSALRGDPYPFIDRLMLLAVQGMPGFPAVEPEARLLASIVDASGEPSVEAFLRRRSEGVPKEELEGDRDALLDTLEQNYPESDAKALGRQWCADVIGTGNLKDKMFGVTSKLRARGRGKRGDSRDLFSQASEWNDDK